MTSIDFDLDGRTIRAELPSAHNGLHVTLSIVDDAGRIVAGPQRVAMDVAEERRKFAKLAGLNADQAARLPVLRERILQRLERPTAAALTPFTAAELLAREFPPLVWIVPGLIPEGGGLLVGKGKLGKSWLVLALSLAVAMGGRAFGKVAVEPGDVLYLALEDGERRLQRRLAKLLGGAPPPPTWHAQTAWPSLDDGGLEAIEAWVADHPGARLIIIDTLKKVRARREDRRDGLYDLDYESVAPLTELGQRRRCCVLAVHHSRKADAEDIVDEISGSTGLSAASETLMIFKRERGAGDARLYISGRDLEDDRDVSLTWDGATGQWVLTGDAAEVKAAKDELETARHRRWLRVQLAGGRRLSQELFVAAKRVGISRDALYAAKDAVAAVARKDGHGAWYWELQGDLRENLAVSSEVQEVPNLPPFHAGLELTTDEDGWPEVPSELPAMDDDPPEVPMPHEQG